MKLSGEQIGVVLGYIVLITLAIGTGYSTGAFIEWKSNPGQWFMATRIISVVLTFIILLTKLVTVEESPVDEERR